MKVYYVVDGKSGKNYVHNNKIYMNKLSNQQTDKNIAVETIEIDIYI